MPTKGRDLVIPDVSLPEFLWESCIGRGDDVAVVDCSKNGASLTYREIYDRSRNCAAFLHQNGAKPGDIIALCSRNPVEFLIAMLGIMGCGATVTPCTSEHKYGEFVQLFTISEPKMVFIDESAVETMKKVKAYLPCLETIFVIGESDEFTTLDSIILRSTNDMGFLNNIQINPSEDIAMLPYSSGTTGLPKSVMLTHSNMIASVLIAIEGFKLREEFVWYIDRPMYHIAGFSVAMSMLNAGTKLILEKEFQIDRMLEIIEKYRITNVLAVPPVLIDLANAEKTNKYDTSSLLEIVFGGAATATDITQRVAKKFNVLMRQVYGMTEAFTISAESAGDSVSSDGFLTLGVEAKIVDLTTSEECPLGQNGEILVKGRQVMKGYLKNPEATAKTIDEDGWMHTGDIGHLDEDGRLYVIDRLKEVIKYKTTQIAPGELESVILKHPKVADVGVIGIPDPDVGEVPRAFVVKKDSSLTEQEIDAFVKIQLVDYKQLRGGVELVKSIPKSATGKIQRKELQKMAGMKI